MKGLLIKDLKLVKTQRTFLLIVTAICAALLLSGKGLSVVFAYAAAVFSMLVVSTIGYDEHDNGMSFLFTFPVSRKKYVLEKYILGVLASGAVLVVGSGMTAVISAAGLQSFQMQEWYVSLMSSLLTAVLILTVALPVQLKFGAEKGRIVMFIAVAVLLGIGYAVEKAAEVFRVDLSGVIDKVEDADTLQVTVFLIVLMGILLGISYMVSAAVIKRRQF